MKSKKSKIIDWYLHHCTDSDDHQVDSTLGPLKSGSYQVLSSSLFIVLWFYRDPTKYYGLQWVMVCTIHKKRVFQMDTSKVSHLSPNIHLINHHIKAREWLCKLTQYWHYMGPLFTKLWKIFLFNLKAVFQEFSW